MATAAILGTAGYTGQETLDRLIGHPSIEVLALGSDSHAGSAALPACESEASARTSIEGCPISRSSVSWPVYPAVPRMAAVAICVLCTNDAIYAKPCLGGRHRL